MREKIITLFLMAFTFMVLFGASAPVAEPVYGGYIQDYDAIATSTTTTRVFISTLSANSMFYADVDNTIPTAPVFGTFQTIPDIDADDGYGTNIRCFAADEGSGYVFVGAGSGELLGTNTIAGNIYTVDTGIAEDIEIIYSNTHSTSYIFWIKYAGADVNLHFGEISSSGVVFATGQTTITNLGYSGIQRPEIMVNPANDHLYVFEDGTPPIIHESSDAYYAISNSTTFTTIPVTDLNATGKDYFAAGISPSGRIFVGGNVQDPHDSYIGYTDDNGVNWTTFSINAESGWGSRISFADTSPDYHVFFGRAVSNDNGIQLSWSNMASTLTPVMDSPHCADPLNTDLIYLRTDWGLGYYDCSAVTASEWNDGITAVQVSAFDMDETKEYAWVASKSGVWYVEDYTTAPNWISQPLWPGNDSTPYRSIATTSTANPVYAGSQSRVWKYDTSYGALTSANFVEIMDLGALGLTIGPYASCIAIDDYSATERVYVGVHDFEDHDETTEDRGNLYQVDYNGSSWSNTAIIGGEIPADGIDPNDVVVVQEGGNTVLYVGVDYHVGSSDTANGVYRCEYIGGSWVNTFDFIEAGSMIHINASIEDLYVTDDDIIFACGTDEFGLDVKCYYKAVGDTYWTVVSYLGLPSPGVGNAITYDEVNQDMYIAVNSSVYVWYYGATSWTTYFDYPAGTSIEFLYYDDLLVGTDYGLFGHEAEEEPLPVTLSSFTGYFENNSAIIEWTTQSESHNSGWNIYRSNSDNFGQSFSLNNDLIDGFGTTSEQHHYSFEDTNEFENGFIYNYWLESVEYSGNTELFGPISLEVEIEPDNPDVPSVVVIGLLQNYPNPFNPETEIKFAVVQSGNAELSIYNIKGQKVITLFDDHVSANEYITVNWNGKDSHQNAVSSGVYMYKLKTDNKEHLRKMILMK
ncbi:MAG: T9SS type A sorting domain-containing protein [Candidatus Cloacimonetes bacterium]|nr:T9SS type A sorting domain-containing protein [Candidatus Cloacimonadota bacterium]